MKIARIKNEKIGETYAIVSEDEKRLITKSEIQEQTGIPIPPRIKEFKRSKRTSRKIGIYSHN